MKVKDIMNFLESIAPPSLQEDYDNAGLIIGDKEMLCSGALICLDVTEAVLQEALKNKCNLIIAHHPAIFRGLKKINGKDETERIVISAIKNDIALYAIHTNLDNVLAGVNGKIAEKIGLENIRVLQPKNMQLKKLIVFAPKTMAVKIQEAVFTAGGGQIGNYSECSFVSEGDSTFKPGEGADPAIGKIGKREELKELKMEFIFQSYKEQDIITAMKDAHDYEEPAYDIITLGNHLTDTGSGLIGELSEPMTEHDFFQHIYNKFNLSVIKHSHFTGRSVTKVALCGGAGSFLRNEAKAAGADVFISSDLKYHEFFDADGQILLADIGHYESEQFTTELLYDLLRDKFLNFALLKTGVNTNPVHCFVPKKN